MYAQVADIVSALGCKAVVISYDDNDWTYLLWELKAARYVTVSQEDIWSVDRWGWGRIEEFKL